VSQTLVRVTAWASCGFSLLVARTALAPDAAVCVPDRVKAAPAEGAVDVPRNTRVWVFDDLCDPTARLFRIGIGDEIPMARERSDPGDGWALSMVYVFKPQWTLGAGTMFRIEMASLEGSSLPPQTFTTGDVVDTEAPVFAGATAATATTANWPLDCFAFACFYRVTADPSTSPDVAAYRLYRRGTLVATAPTPDARFIVAGDCDVSPPGCGEGETPPVECFVLRAVDLAGNEESNTVGACTDGRVILDAGLGPPDPPPDSGPESTDGASAASPRDGCACFMASAKGAGASVGSLGLGALLAWVVLRSHRRARRNAQAGEVPPGVRHDETHGA
jgi:hypothetical protein